MGNRFDWRRAALYGAAAPIVGGLLWSLFCYEPVPEFAQLLSQINANLRLAQSVPAIDKDGNRVPAHDQLLAAAERDIALANGERKDSAVLAEFDGFAKSLRGDFQSAAERYRFAQSLQDCTDEQRPVLAFNEARMLRRAGRPAECLQVLTAAQAWLPAGYATQARLERAEILAQQSRSETASSVALRKAAESLLREVLAADSPMAWAQAGHVWLTLDNPAEAEAAWARASASVPVADGFRARLKLRQGDVDTALQLFERAANAAPAEMRRLVREDMAAWQAIAEDARFVRLVDPKSAAPVR